MAWTIQQDFTPFSVVYLEVTPTCYELKPQTDYFESRGWPELTLAKMAVEIEEPFWPKAARLKSARKQLPNLLGFCSFPGFSRALMECVEALEPGVHDFRQVQISDKSGASIPDHFYAVNVRRLISELVDFEKTLAPSREVVGRRILSALSPAYSGKVVIRADRVDGMHLWRSEEIGRHLTVSNSLFDLLKSRRLLRGLEAIELKEK
jgi:hypothetical protein